MGSSEKLLMKSDTLKRSEHLVTCPAKQHDLGQEN